MKKNDTSYPICEWEHAIAERNDIDFIEFRMEKNLVSTAIGHIIVRGHKRLAIWHHDGHCYYRGNRAKSYDINLHQS